MDLKTKIFDQVSAARTGQKTVNEATESILDLLDVVERSEQLSFCKCDKPSPDIMYGKTAINAKKPPPNRFK